MLKFELMEVLFVNLSLNLAIPTGGPTLDLNRIPAGLRSYVSQSSFVLTSLIL